MSMKIFKGKDKEIARLLMELCEKYYEGPSMKKTASSIVINSNLEEEFLDPSDWSCFGYEGVVDELRASNRGTFTVKVTAPLSDWYIDRSFKDEEEESEAYSDFEMYGGYDMSFADAVRCVIERQNTDFRFDSGTNRKRREGKLTKDIIDKLNDLYEECAEQDYRETL